MKNKNSVTVAGGTSISMVVQIVFIILKLCKVINWSWWLVLIPIEIDFACILLESLILFIYYIIQNYKNRKLDK